MQGSVYSFDMTLDVIDEPPSWKKSYIFPSRTYRAWSEAPRPKISMLAEGKHDENKPHGWMHMCPYALPSWDFCFAAPPPQETTLRFGVPGWLVLMRVRGVWPRIMEYQRACRTVASQKYRIFSGRVGGKGTGCFAEWTKRTRNGAPEEHGQARCY